MSQALPIGLDEATTLEGEDGRFSTGLDEAWEIWGPSGGYLAALALRAAVVATGIAQLCRIPLPSA